MSLTNPQIEVARVVLDFRKRAMKEKRDYAKIFEAFDEMVKEWGITRERAKKYFPDLDE